MIYDKTPPYPHYAHLPYAQEPWKSLYVFQRLATTLMLVPWWAFYYTIAPRRFRPRSSWNLRQIINVNFTRRIYKVTEVAGVTWGTRDPTVAPDQHSLKETVFEWVPPLKEQYRTGIVRDGDSAPFTQVGCYKWVADKKTGRRFKDDSKGLDSPSERPIIVGVYMHGGGYCHMSAHESSRTSRIPRGLIERGIFDEIHSVEYRLLQVAPFPAVVQDAAAVYAHVVETFAARRQRYKIILIGDSSGGNLVLALSRWLRDENHLPGPDGLILLSPSCDTSHAVPETLSSYIPRPNQWSDYLVDTPEPRALLQRTFLGFNDQSGPATPEQEHKFMQIVHSEYVSPCSPIVLERWGHTVQQDPEGKHTDDFWKYGLPNLPTFIKSARAPENINKLAEGYDDSASPYRKTCQFPALFSSFPKTIVVCGDAERLVREVRSLVGAMAKDGVDVTTYWAPDACHDPLMLNPFWWDKRALESIWEEIAKWTKEFEQGKLSDSESESV